VSIYTVIYYVVCALQFAMVFTEEVANSRRKAATLNTACPNKL